MLEVLFTGPSPLESPRSPFATPDERRMRERSPPRGGKRTPRRAQTHHDYQLPSPPMFVLHTPRQQPEALEETAQRLQLTNGESSSRKEQQPPGSNGKQQDEGPQQQQLERKARPRRPPLGPPRRSYSVTDREPIPHHHRLSTRINLADMPAELHYLIFDFLDPIDSTCLGLTNRHFYAIHRRMHGTVALSTKRDGPNELEWAWHVAGNIVRRSSALTLDPAVAASASVAIGGLGEKEKKALSRLRVRGQAYCRKCGVTRCELQKHIRDWMGDDLEYCSVRQKFGAAAPEGAKPYCYMSKPGDPRRCGRHHVRRTTVVLK